MVPDRSLTSRRRLHVSLGVAVALVAGSGSLLAQQAPAPRFAWVNSQIIVQQTPGYAAAESTLAVEIQSFRVEVQNLQAQLDSAIRAYDQQEIVLSPTNRQAKQEEIRQMQQRLNQRFNDLQTRASERERELLEPIEERVKGVIEGIRAERNYAFVFDVTAPGNNILAADRTLDITALVVERLTASQ